MQHPMSDTISECQKRRESRLLYSQGGKPHFGLPAIKTAVAIWEDNSVELYEFREFLKGRQGWVFVKGWSK